MSAAFPATAHFQNILVIKPSSLGDVATALPLLCDIKHIWPNAGIDWLLNPALSPLLEGHPALREIIPFDRKLYSQVWRSRHAVKGLFGLAAKLRDKKYDCVFDAQGLLRSGVLARITGAPFRIGFRDAREGSRMFYTHHAQINRPSALAVVRMRTLLEPLGLKSNAPAEFCMPIQPAASEKIAAFMPAHAVAIIPGSRGAAKRWDADAFVEIIQRLQRRGRPAVLFGSKDEADICRVIAERSTMEGHCTINLAGSTSLAEMIAGLARAALTIGNDTGPLHVAVALGKPVVGIYGPTDPASVGPYGQLHHVVRFDPKHRSPDDIEKVWEKTREILNLPITV